MKNKPSLAGRLALMLLVFYTILWLLIFIPAGDVQFYNGWIYFGVFCTATLILSFYFLKTNPELIKRRTKTEQEKPQIVIQSIMQFCFSFY